MTLSRLLAWEVVAAHLLTGALFAAIRRSCWLAPDSNTGGLSCWSYLLRSSHGWAGRMRDGSSGAARPA